MNLEPSAPASAAVALETLLASSPTELRTQAAAAGLDPALAPEELVGALVQRRLQAGAEVRADGVLEVLPDGFGFVRSTRHQLAPMPHDVFVSAAQIRALHLRTGHRLAGPLRAPRPGERCCGFQHVDRVNGADADAVPARVPFATGMPVLPTRRLELAFADAELRAIDLLAPWARGHRILLRLPPAAGGAALLTHLANAMAQADQAPVRILALVDQRPEALAAAQGALAGHDALVLGTTFDEPPSRHVAVAEFALQIAQREVEAGRDVVLLCDDLVRLARASNLVQAPSGRLLSAGLDATAVLGGKRLFAAARALAGGGSLTVIATVSVGDTLADQAIAEQFARRGNSEVTFAAGTLPGERRLDVAGTWTRREDLLLAPPLDAAFVRLHEDLRRLPATERDAALAARLAGAPDNRAVLQQIAAARQEPR